MSGSALATGKIINPVISETRTEADFLSNLRGVVQFDPTARFRIVLDNLNTHCSESCARFVAEQYGIDTASLGEKGNSGILKDRHTR